MASEDGLAPGRVLYHYTSAPGFLGILERRCLFASDVWFLNDASEVRYAQTRMAERCSLKQTTEASCLQVFPSAIQLGQPRQSCREGVFSRACARALPVR